MQVADETNKARRQAKFLTYDITDFTLSAHAQNGIPGHAFRKLWVFTDISNI